jgi:DNA invertase Pin-like site-specific DNA recombinase
VSDPARVLERAVRRYRATQDRNQGDLRAAIRAALDAGVTVTEVARIADLSRTTIYRYDQEEQP